MRPKSSLAMLDVPMAFGFFFSELEPIKRAATNSGTIQRRAYASPESCGLDARANGANGRATQDYPSGFPNRPTNLRRERRRVRLPATVWQNGPCRGDHERTTRAIGATVFSPIPRAIHLTDR